MNTTSAEPTLVALTDVHKHFDPSHVLRGITLSVKQGEWVALMGPSGCGKSTLLNIVGGLDDATRGDVHVGNQSLTKMTSTQRAVFRRAHIGIVFQAFNLIPHLDVQSNIEVPLRLSGSSTKQARIRSGQLTAELDLADLRRAAPATLSGGQQQRVALARALAARPAVLLADEPTGSLDSESTEVVLNLLRSEHRSGQTIVMVTHDYQVASAANRIVRMLDGTIADAHSTQLEHRPGSQDEDDTFFLDAADHPFHRLVQFE